MGIFDRFRGGHAVQSGIEEDNGMSNGAEIHEVVVDETVSDDDRPGDTHLQLQQQEQVQQRVRKVGGSGWNQHLLVEVVPIGSKNIGDDVRAAKDLKRFSSASDNSCVLLDVHVLSAYEAVSVALKELENAQFLPSDLMHSAKHSILLNTAASSASLEQSTSTDIDAGVENAASSSENESPDEDVSSYSWKKSIQGDTFIVAHGRVHGLKQQMSVFVRFQHPLNLGLYNDGLVRFLVIVLGPTFEQKQTKTEVAMAQNYAAMLNNEQFYVDAIEARSELKLREAVSHYVSNEQEFTERLHNEPDLNAELDPFQDMKRTGRFFGGFIQDIKRKYRWKVYKSDWTDGMNDGRSIIKYISTIAWLYFAVIMPVIAFGALNDQNTNKEIGISETILSQAISGLTYSILAGQPLAIPMVTGPVTVFISVIYLWCEGLQIEFLPFYTWTGIWSTLILTIIVAFDLIAYVRYVGQFTEEIFAMLVACIFISQYIKPLIHVAQDESTTIFLLSFVLATGTYMFSRALSLFERKYWLNATTRTLLSDFGMPMSVLFWSGIRYIFSNVEVDSLEIPDSNGIVTTNGRNWIVPLGNISIAYIFLAIVPALFLSMLFYVDQNVAVLLTNKSENKLQKGSGYFLDMQVVAFNMLILSLLGVPWTNAAVPHSHLHAQILADSEEYESHGMHYSRVVKAREVRITSFLTHVLILCSLFLLVVVGKIPSSVVWGFFLYIGVSTLDGNQYFERLMLAFMQPEKYPPNHYVRRVKLSKIALYTLIQTVLLVFLWFVNENFYISNGGVFKAGLLFPFVIMLFIPIRVFVLPKWFTKRELNALEMEKEDNHS
eukprot:CAMPEP_0182445442 /NCGR_PEP_ID=MMETSP1172-20130603/3561_1 /TAXON_ID=708627 /ORGANISM="Timspurckia oligopyrenoides, Strain CCMP3278" /LENGTH=831 /DNA_ID=CAMNT_0024641215 /DNA_START=100 /DNA_END=2595 /DNA_ORIENTATION=+